MEMTLHDVWLLGYCFAMGRAHKRKQLMHALAIDAESYKGKREFRTDENGKKYAFDPETGKILGGLGPELKGKTIRTNKAETSQPEKHQSEKIKSKEEKPQNNKSEKSKAKRRRPAEVLPHRSLAEFRATVDTAVDHAKKELKFARTSSDYDRIIKNVFLSISGTTEAFFDGRLQKIIIDRHTSNEALRFIEGRDIGFRGLSMLKKAKDYLEAIRRLPEALQNPDRETDWIDGASIKRPDGPPRHPDKWFKTVEKKFPEMTIVVDFDKSKKHLEQIRLYYVNRNGGSARFDKKMEFLEKNKRLHAVKQANDAMRLDLIIWLNRIKTGK